MALIQDYKDVIKLAYQTEVYWTKSKQLTVKGHHWYNLDIPIATPKGIEFSAPPTAPSLINDAADHLAGNWPDFHVKALKETQQAEKDQERIEIALNTMYRLLAREQGKALHRTMAIHGGWSGMMCARIGLHDTWDMDDPKIQDIYWQPVDPRYVFPDPGSLGKEFVIYRMRRTVGSIRQAWPDWEGQWYAPAGWGFWNQGPDTRPRLNERLPDFMVVDWIEYWDDTYKCFLSNGHPVFQPTYGQDLLPHGMGINPFIIRSSGYGDDTGEPHERFRSMLYYVFSMLEAEARLWTQYKWIVEDTAWPVIIAHDSMKPLDLTPASVNYVTDLLDVEKGIRTLREDAVDPKALIDVLGWVSNVIERATYPVILKGTAPAGIRAGYPIAILSTQAKVKFASPSDALKDMLQELAYKTLAVIQNRIQVPVAVMDGYKLEPTDYEKYQGRIDVSLDPNLPTDRAALIPSLELAVGSLGLPKERALKDLGYEDPVELRELRTAEDIADDPRVRQVMAEHFVKFLAPEYAAAVEEESQSQLTIQKLGEQIQLLQAKIQVMEAQQQLQQMTQQMQQMGAQAPGGGMGAPSTGAPPGPSPMASMSPPGQQGGARQGSGGSPAFGQNPTNPNGMGQGLSQSNPATAARGIASALRAGRTISDLSSQDAAYGSPDEGAGAI
jgi:hypothetical protein